MSKYWVMTVSRPAAGLGALVGVPAEALGAASGAERQSPKFTPQQVQSAALSGKLAAHVAHHALVFLFARIEGGGGARAQRGTHTRWGTETGKWGPRLYWAGAGRGRAR